MPLVTLFSNEYSELLTVCPSAEAVASRDANGNWRLDMPKGVQSRFAQEVEAAMTQTERHYQELGRQIWLTRPQITDDEFAKLDAQHGEAERRQRVLARVLAALLDGS